MTSIKRGKTIPRIPFGDVSPTFQETASGLGPKLAMPVQSLKLKAKGVVGSSNSKIRDHTPLCLFLLGPF